MKFLDRFLGPPTEAKFAKLLIEALRRAGDEHRYVHDEPEHHLTISRDGEEVGVFNLANLFGTYCGMAKKDRPEFIQHVCAAVVNRMDVPKDFEDVKPDLRPTVRSRSMLELLRLGAERDGGEYVEIPSMPLSEHLLVCLVYDLPKTMRFVKQQDLETWGVSLYEAMEVARQNLFENQPARYASVGDKFYIFETGDAYDGTRMLMLDMIRGLEVVGMPVALPISRDCLMITGSEDIDGQQMMVELAEKQLGRPRPLCSIPHVFNGDEWMQWKPSIDNPNHEKFRLLEMRHLGGEYAEQKQALEKWTERKGVDVFVATFSGLQKDEKDLSFCVWSKGVASWLPKTDLVAFIDQETKQTQIVLWDRTVAELGEMMEELDYYPPRWSVTEFPSKEQLETMATERD